MAESPVTSDRKQTATTTGEAVRSAKFLKRKPDNSKKQPTPSKKHRESSISRGTTEDDPRFITQKKGTGSDCEGSLLETAKSDSSLFQRKRELGAAISRVYEEASRISKDSFFSRQEDSLPLNDDYNHFATPRHSKKSRTEFFNLELCSQASALRDGQPEQGKQAEVESREQLREECESLGRKNRWLEEQLDGYAEREYLLRVEREHLSELLRERERRISTLQREALEKERAGEGGWREEAASLAGRLAREEQRYLHLKEENDYLQTELIAKNEELIAFYAQHDQLEARLRKERASMAVRLERMRCDLEKARASEADEAGGWREKALRLQQEVKYLQIQNQCLLIAKEELVRTEADNRKLKDERDYFKHKVMEHIRRTKRMHELSRSANSSLLLELSDPSVEQ